MPATVPNRPQLPHSPTAKQDKLGRRVLSRRDLLRQATAGTGALGLSALLAACGGDGDSAGRPAPKPAGSLGALGEGAAQLSLLNAQSQLPDGRQLFTFGLATADNRLVTGGRPQVWTAKDETGKALGPFPAEWLMMDAYTQTGDKSPRSELVGFYVAEVEFPTTGNWLIAAVVDGGGTRGVGRAALPIADKVPAQVGSKALATPTLVARSKADLAKVCTRTPPCTLHEISLDRAVKSGKPTAVSFSTPLFCSSRMCGPAVDELLLAAREIGDRANFIHVEQYPNAKKPEKPVKAFTDWGFQTEPWTIVIDGEGVIRARFEGPLTDDQVVDALRPLL
jgi:hypothetical protein